LNVGYLSLPDAPLPTYNAAAYWVPCVLVQLAWAVLLLVASAFIVRRHARGAAVKPAGPGSGIIPPAAEEAPHPLAPAAPVSAGATATEVSNNPVLWRELRRPLLGRRASAAAVAIAFVLLFISYGMFGSIHALDEAELQFGYAFIFHTLMGLLVCVLSSTAIAQEKESDTWTLLLGTPLSARQIVLGKLAGLFRRLVWPLLFVVIHFVFFLIGGVISAEAVLLVVCLMVTCNTLFAATGVYLSLRLRRVTTAVIVNLLLALFLYGGVPIILLILGEVLAHTDRPAEIALMGLPYVYMEAAIHLRPLSARVGYGNQLYLPIGSVSVAEFYQIVAIVMAMHMLLGGAVVAWTIRRFDRIVGRAGRQVR
jgi:ABC-type transport system involved in multi-copper enzyme maturation permease subunit